MEASQEMAEGMGAGETASQDIGICPFAVSKLLPDTGGLNDSGEPTEGVPVNHWKGGITPRLYVVHIMQGYMQGTYETFLNPYNQVSSHFAIGNGTEGVADGEIWQFVRVTDTAWHNANGNPYSIGVESAGFSGNPLTDAQVESHARLFEWAHDLYPAIAYWRNLRPFTGRGLSWHGLGGQDWGNHPDCPGAPIVTQLPLILRLGEDQP